MHPLLRLAVILLLTPGSLFAAWETWDGCTLVADRYFDGDSFQVKHGRKTYVLRLYFIDAPETDAGYPQRVAEQAAYFGVSSAQALNAGSSAKDFTTRFLSKPFRVYTRLQSRARREPAGAALRDRGA